MNKDICKLTNYNCEVCGKIATNGVQDLADITGPLDTFRKYERHGDPYFFCDEHTRLSEVINKKDIWI